MPGVRCDYRQLQTNPLNYPVEIRIASLADVSTKDSSENIHTLRQIARQVEDARGVHRVERRRDERVTPSSDHERARLHGLAGRRGDDVAGAALVVTAEVVVVPGALLLTVAMTVLPVRTETGRFSAAVSRGTSGNSCACST